MAMMRNLWHIPLMSLMVRAAIVHALGTIVLGPIHLLDERVATRTPGTCRIK